MKLYLSSYMLGDHQDRLLEMCGRSRPTVAVITNALDAMPLHDRPGVAKAKYDPLPFFSDNGFAPALVDLREYFGQADKLAEMLKRYDLIWAVGGNSFLLRRAMRDSGFDMIVRDLLANGIVYGGWSAGACVAGNRMEAVALMDEPAVTAPGYVGGDIPMSGLGLVPFTIIPHYDSDHFEAPLASKAVAWAKAQNISHIALRDGEVIVTDGDATMVLPRSCS